MKRILLKLIIKLFFKSIKLKDLKEGKHFTIKHKNTIYAKTIYLLFKKPIIYLPKRYDIGLYMHEKTHVKQYYQNKLHIIFLCSKKYRDKCEAEAQKMQFFYGK